MPFCLLHPEALRALEKGVAGDAFSLLGFQRLEGGGSLIRVFNPAFRGVSIEHDGGVTPCENVSGTGCFEALFPDRSEPFPYRICAFLPALGLLTYFLPNLEPGRKAARA